MILTMKWTLCAEGYPVVSWIMSEDHNDGSDRYIKTAKVQERRRVNGRRVGRSANRGASRN